MTQADEIGAGRRVVLGVGGGIAAYKAALLLRQFTEAGFDVTVVPTEAALHFVGEPTWSALSGHEVTAQVWDSVEQVRHVKLGQEADLVVVAPATANLIAKAAHGLADDLLTNVLLTAAGPVVMAPAMHTEMWEHPATQANVATLRERGVHVIDPASGRLTGKDSGKGRMPEPEDIYAEATTVLAQTGGSPERATQASDVALQGTSPSDLNHPLRGRRVVVSAGGTREAIDPVRFLGNRSSGKQGYALAEVAARLGAHVTLVSCNVELSRPAGVEDVIEVESALDLRAAMFEAALDSPADVVVMAAAVADFRPRVVAEAKVKKTHDESVPEEEQDAPVIELVRNPDVLADLVAERNRRGLGSPLMVGFAAETGDEGGSVLEYARAKLARKGVDLLVANEVGRDVTFGKDSSSVYLLRPGALEGEPFGPATKHEVARFIWDAVGVLDARS